MVLGPGKLGVQQNHRVVASKIRVYSWGGRLTAVTIDKVLCEPKGDFSRFLRCCECFPKVNPSEEAPAEVYEKRTLSNKQLSLVLLSRRMFSQ